MPPNIQRLFLKAPFTLTPPRNLLLFVGSSLLLLLITLSSGYSWVIIDLIFIVEVHHFLPHLEFIVIFVVRCLTLYVGNIDFYNDFLTCCFNIFVLQEHDMTVVEPVVP